MSETPQHPTEPVIRAERFELVDQAGRLRGLWGLLPSPDPGDRPLGLVLFDEAGRQRLWLALHTYGPNLSVDLGGETVAMIGANDPGSGDHVGAYAFLADTHGAPVVGAYVEADGSVSECRPSAVSGFVLSQRIQPS
ncbi:MAG: hypothetical protein QOK43_1985 [Acidimicrobiaceae bacterium]|nr:hypothetical protein [Acidimicrobiaceae bacterium]